MKSGKKILSLLLTLAVLVLAVCMLFSCKNTVTVSFESDGGTNVASVTLEPGATVSAPENPIREGYVFAGWKTQDGVLWDFNTPVTSDTLLIASWVRDDALDVSTVKYDLKGGDKTDFVTSVTVPNGSVLEAPKDPVRPGYSFAGWFYLGEEFDFTNKVVAEDITLVAHWNLLTYSISYNLQGGKLEAPVTSYTTESGAEIPNPTKQGYDFVGWSYDTATSLKSSLVIPKGAWGNLALTAVWAPTEYSISYDFSGAEDTLDRPTKYNIESESFTVAPVEKEAYVFLGWQVNGEGDPILDLTIEKGSHGNLTLKAIFELKKYEIEFALAGGVNNPENPLYTTLESPEFTLKAPTRHGYDFVGWQVNGEGTPSLDVKVPAGATETLKYTAVWEKGTYTLTYYDFNGKFHEGESIPESFTLDTLPIKLPNLYFNNKCFISWYTDADFSNPITEITECKNTTLYAKFVDATEGLAYAFNGESYEVVGYTGTESVVAIPEFYKLTPVTAIASGAFASSSVTELYLPESIRVIGEKAFFGAASLELLHIPESAKLTTIEKLAFAGTAIADFKAPATLKIIGEGAFLGCASLKTLNLGETSVEYIMASAFEGTSLESVTVPASIQYVGAKAFFSAANLKYVEFESGAGIVSIGAESFKNCISLESINIPGGVASIENSAFENCVALSKLDLDSAASLISIGSSAFRNCDALVSVSIPDSVSEIGDYAFYSSDALVSVEFASSAALEAIGKNAFASSGLKAVVLPESLKLINEGAFANAKALESVIFNEGLLLIEKSAFRGCTAIKELNIPYSTTAVTGSFEGCSALESLTINKFDARDIFGGALPVGIKSVTLLNESAIAEGVFAGCTALESVSVPFVGLTQPGFEIEVDGNKLSATATHVKNFAALFGGAAPMSLKNVTVTGGSFVPDGAFLDCAYIESIVLPSSTVSVGNGAFAGCTGLSYLEMPMAMTGDFDSDYYQVSTTVDGDEVFYDVSKKTLSYVFGGTVPQSLRRVKISAYGEDTAATLPDSIFVGSSVREVTLVGFNAISDYAFAGVATLAKLDISASAISEIGEKAFFGTAKLSSFLVPKTVTAIGDYAFEGSGVQEISFEEGALLESIGDGAFLDCASLAKITLPDSIVILPISIFENCTSLETIEISSKVYSIETNAFAGCTALKSVSFGEKSELVMINSGAFMNTGLESFTLPLNVSVISTSAFENCAMLKEFYFTAPKRGEIAPESVIISDAAFKNSGITAIAIPANVIIIGNNAFEACTSLTTVSFAEASTLNFVGNYAFADCEKLTAIAIPDGVTVIPTACFKNCGSLRSFVLGDASKVMAFADSAFSGCIMLETVSIPKGLQLIENNAFENCFTLRAVNLPLRVVTPGQNGEGDVVTESPLIYIGELAFKNCDSITSITIPASVLELGAQAFYNCDKLASVTFEEGIMIAAIPEGMFLNCKALSAVVIPDSVYEIGASAFQGCSALASVSFGEASALTVISNNAFSGCASLVSFKAPAALDLIGEEAFRACSNLESFEITTNVTAIADFAFRESQKLVIKITYFYQGGDVDWLATASLGTYWNSDGNTVEFSLLAPTN